MELILTAILDALQQAQIPAESSFRQGVMPQLSQPLTLVCVRTVKAETPFSYLGQRQVGQDIVPVYGQPLLAKAALRVYAPRKLGSDAALGRAFEILELLAQGVEGLRIGEAEVSGAEYDRDCDCFVCTVSADVRALRYAAANEDETEFTDFILKGEAQ